MIEIMPKVVMKVVENGSAEIDRESSKQAHFTSFATFYTYISFNVAFK